jgi:Holliday junction resolvase RusA-like endonuclease
MMKFTILGIPQAKQSARFRIQKGANGKSFVKSYQSAEIKDKERNIAYDIKSQLPVGHIPLDGALGLKALFVFPPGKWSKKKLAALAAGEVFYKETRPDLQDNLMKMTSDAMNGIVYTDDSRICKTETQKIYGLVPRIEIEIYEL